MREGHASRTAQHNALFRALEAALPEDRRLFDDPLAQSFLRRPLSLVPPLARVPGFRAPVLGFIDRNWPGVRSSLIARTRLIDDALAVALEQRPEQFIVLGAGFDTRSYRLPALSKLRVFEVDHPDTQAHKREALRAALGHEPDHVRFVASDFSEGNLESSLEAEGYDPAARSIILWEGVTGYLTAEAVDATLSFCSRGSPGSELIFTYLHRDVITNPAAFAGTERLFKTLERAGEQLTFGIEPEKLRVFLAERGFSLESDLGAAEYRALYLGGAARGIRGHEFYHVAQARVVGPDPPRG